ncbi:TetR/AcrR family transcriptional regulator [Microbacterium sp. NPDC055357]
MPDSTSPVARDDWRDFDSDPLPPILTAALGCFVEHGYHGTTTRSMAAAAGLSVPGLYHHYPSKHDIIVELMRRAMDDLYARSLGALAEGATVEERFALHIECLVRFHAQRQQLAFIAATEIRSMQPAARARHIATRDRQQALLERIIAEGVKSGDFRAVDVKATTRAIITMCTGVSQWYRPAGGTLSPDEVARQYVAVSQQIVRLDSHSV